MGRYHLTYIPREISTLVFTQEGQAQAFANIILKQVVHINDLPAVIKVICEIFRVVRLFLMIAFYIDRKFLAA